MPKQQQTKEYRTFIKGIITEASPLTFPENASIDEENFVINRDGSRHRKLGIDYENLYSVVDTSYNASSMETYAVASYRWDNVDNKATTSLVVVQVGPKLFFLDATEDAISSNIKNGGLPVTLSSTGTHIYQMSAINGVLVVTTGETSPFYLEYDALTDTITKTDISIKTRDLWGIEDALKVDERPATLSDLHKYNLLNQGWTTANINSVAFPSNADVQYLGKDSADAFSAALLKKQFFGTTPAPRGKYIIDAFSRGTSRLEESGVTVPLDTDNGFITTACAHSGRIFYAGIVSTIVSGDSKSPNYTGFIFFTKTLDNLDSLSHCYQEADPTSEHVSDLIDTDGGYVTIPDASNIYKIVSYTNSVVIFADNGVWRLFSTQKGFTATDQELERISTVGAMNATSIVVAEDIIYYWSVGGIYTIQPEEVSGNLVASNISQNTIQSLYTDIPSAARFHARGIYDATTKRVSWLYNADSTYDGVIYTYKYNRELVFDTLLGAFYKTKISSLTTSSPYVADYITTVKLQSADNIQMVVRDGIDVQVNGDTVNVTTTALAGTAPISIKYLTLIPTATYGFTFSYYKDLEFLDWKTEDSTGVDSPAYLYTGYELYGDTMRTKQVPYIFFHFERTEDGYAVSGNGIDYTNPSSCLVQAQWGWSDSINSGRWGTSFQAYRLNRHYIPADVNDTFDYGFSVVTTKNKLRGKGKALSLYIKSEPGKNIRLLGWAISAAGTTIP